MEAVFSKFLNMNKEELRLEDPSWKKWGPYLSERQWGTVREDYSENGQAWDFFPHDQARSRVYRWGEDGIAGISDNMQRICFALGVWNGRDDIIKERLFGLTGSEGNHGEDVKELYYYLDNTPSHSYMKYLYKYPQAAYPYNEMVTINRGRSKSDPEFEITDTRLFDKGHYFDLYVEYAKNHPEDICIRITAFNRGPAEAYLAVLPTIWMRNLWSFGLLQKKPSIALKGDVAGWGCVELQYEDLGNYYLYFDTPSRKWFTENETNTESVFGIPNSSPLVKDAFHTAIKTRSFDQVEEKKTGTKFSPLYEFVVAPKSSVSVRLRLSKTPIHADPLHGEYDIIFANRLLDAEEFYRNVSKAPSPDLFNIQRQAFAGLLWGKQYFNIDIPRWLNGDPGQPLPPETRKTGRNCHWESLNNEDIISMPDKWEFPWYAAWDLAFHCVPLSQIDPGYAKEQLLLFLREWYMHPNGQLPAYEWAFGDVNPPVHAWSCIQVYKIEKEKTGKGDIDFLEKAFQKLLINFTWWVNQKDRHGKNVFEGGFLGLDNIGVFDRSSAIPGGGTLEQADGTGWMAMYCLNMLEIALELSQFNRNYEDVTTKFFEHFVYIAESLNRIGEHWTGSWDEEEGFFYDILCLPDGNYIPLKVRSLVGLTTLFAVLVLKKELFHKVPEFHRRLKWFQQYRKDNGQNLVIEELNDHDDILLSLVPKARLKKLLKALLDEQEFLGPGGIRSMSRIHNKTSSIEIADQKFEIGYQPAESNNGLFGGNSNWRGPVWISMNYLIIQALLQYHEYYGEEFRISFPTGSGLELNLEEVAMEIAKRQVGIFQKDTEGRRPVHAGINIYQADPHFKDLILFHEYFHGDTSKGLGASHQTGWTGIIATLINRIAVWEKEKGRNGPASLPEKYVTMGKVKYHQHDTL